MADLNNKTLFVTGASRGIGLAIALRAARDGANIAIAAKTADPHPKLPGTIHTAAAEIEKAGGKALPLVVDVRDEAQVAELQAALTRPEVLRDGQRAKEVHRDFETAQSTLARLYEHWEEAIELI